MSGTQLDGEPGLPSGSVVVVNPTAWAFRALELGRLLAAMARLSVGDRVVPDASGRRPEGLVTISDPLYWSGHVAELADALREPTTGPPLPPGSPLRSGAGAEAETPGRLTCTVEEAAVALGVSRAFAYDAVRRGEIPAVKIGRRILIPRSALKELLDSSKAEPHG